MASPTFANVGDVILDLSVSSDGASVYGAGGGGFNSAAGWSATTGQRLLRDQGRRRHTGRAVQQQPRVHGLPRRHHLGDISLRLLALAPTDGAVDPTFHPSSNSYPGVYCLDADGRYLVAGGYFSNMGGVGVKGLAIFPKA